MLGRRVVVYGGGNTALDVARTAKRLGATEAIIVYRRTREKMPAHDFEVQEALRGGRADQVALDDPQRGRRGHAHRREDGARRRRASRSRRARSRRSRPIPWCWRSARTSTCRCSTACRGSRSRTATVRGRAQHDDRLRGHLRRRRHGALGAHRHRRRGPRQEGRAPHRRVAARRRPTRRRRSTRSSTFEQAQHVVLQRRAQDRAAACSTIARRTSTFDEVVERARRDQRALRGAPVPLLRQLLRVRQLLRRLPGQRGHQAGPGQALRIQLRLLQGLRHLRVAECPCGAIKMVPETI